MGILRNEKAQKPVQFNREDVRTNTEINAHLGEAGIQLREKLKGAPKPQGKYPKTKAPSALQHSHKDEIKFDDQEIADWDAQRGQTEKILEPNTPYMGTATDTEYYDEGEVPELDLEN